MRTWTASAALALLAPALVQAQQTGGGTGGGSSSGTQCGPGNACPQNLPCCSQYGECGVGAYCLGGCDPQYSHSLNSCMPAPFCSSQDYKLQDTKSMQPNTQYLGDASKANWVYSGSPLQYTNPQDQSQQVLLTMAKGTVGTLLATTSYVWYGKISATLKTSRGAGVVTAFILLSDVKDEIDFEFVGTDLSTAQSNYYFQGIPNYTHGGNMSVSGSTFDTYHTYEIDWQPNQITWSIDGKTLRTLSRDSTWNKTANRYDFPQTPSRVQLSLWPAGLSSNGQGTIDWAGGLIDWNAQDVKQTGYYYAMVNEVKVQCYDPPSGTKQNGTTSYIYDNTSGFNTSIEITDQNTALKSFLGSGLQPDLAPSQPSGTSSAASSPSSDVPNVPGLSGAGTGTNGARGGGGSGASPSQVVNNGNGGTATLNSPQSTGSNFHGFSQGNGGSGSGSSGAAAGPAGGERVLHGSFLAVFLAIAALMII